MNYTIIEVANTHGGDINYLSNLIEEFQEYKGDFGMKFQPLHPDKLATKDFAWHNVYKELYFDPKQWESLISEAAKTKDIWLDIFDEYSIEILSNNLSKVYGIKLQVSVLFNPLIRKKLGELNLADKKLILNVAALNLDEIEGYIDVFSRDCAPGEILLEAGFQGYPTQLADSGISKIKTLKERFGLKIVFADHIDANDEYAIWIPSIAVANGADHIEKHVRLVDETKYDAFSSIDKEKFDKMLTHLQNIDGLANASFINEREKKYLRDSILVPILNKDTPSGSGLSKMTDFDYRRSGKKGLNIRNIETLQAKFHLLSVDKKAGDCIQKSDFKKANIAVIIAGRMKSSRLKKKAVLKIGNLSSVETCVRNACKLQNINHVVLATSSLPSDDELANHTFNDSVIFHRGDPDDVIQRYLDIIRTLKIDVVVRVTADMPFIDNEICEFLLNSHFESGADYTTANDAAIGTNLEIINTVALEKVKSYFPKADYSEYMTWYFVNNPEHFRINKIDLPKHLVRDYRLTLDYEEDLEMFNTLYDKLPKDLDFELMDIFEVLDHNPEIPKINQHKTLQYKTDQSLIDTLNKVTKIGSLS